MNSTNGYDIALLGHYTQDTIVSASGTRLVDGGAFNYGAHVAVRMGLKVAAVTRLAREDFRVIDELTRLGVDVFARATPHSTRLRLEYPTANVDERVIYVTSTAGAFTPAEVEALQARAILVGASMRGEVGLEVIEALGKKEALLAADVQGFVRVARDGKLVYEAWPEKRQVLAYVDVLKTDAVEAQMLTGEADIGVAARRLADLGPSEVVLTHRDGVLVYADGQYYAARFFPQKLAGRSGRGDTCITAYVAKRLVAPPAEATPWAAAVTSLKMEAEGPFRREMAEVEDLMRRKYCISYNPDKTPQARILR
jgi:sugar/nucleoside kinase (ribokinase family)